MAFSYQPIATRLRTDEAGDEVGDLAEPGGFGGTHLPAVGIGVIVGAGEVVETVCDVKGEFVIDTLVLRTDLYGAVNVDDEVARTGFTFARYGFVAETDDVGRPVPAEVFPVGLRDAVVIDKYDADLAPAFRCGGGFELVPEPISQLLQLPYLYRMLLLLV